MWYSCGQCGLVGQKKAAIIQHIHEFHGNEKKPRYPNTGQLIVHQLIRPPPGQLPQFDPGFAVASPIRALAARQAGARVLSLWELEGLVKMFQLLLRYADLEPHQHHRAGPALTDCLRLVLAVLGSQQLKPLWQMTRPFWGFFCSFVASGTWKGCNLESFGAVLPTVDKSHIQKRRRSTISRACGQVLAATGKVRDFFRRLSASFDEQVIRSHGKFCASRPPVRTQAYPTSTIPVSYTNLTLPTNKKV